MNESNQVAKGMNQIEPVNHWFRLTSYKKATSSPPSPKIHCSTKPFTQPTARTQGRGFTVELGRENGDGEKKDRRWQRLGDGGHRHQEGEGGERGWTPDGCGSSEDGGEAFLELLSGGVKEMLMVPKKGREASSKSMEGEEKRGWEGRRQWWGKKRPWRARSGGNAGGGEKRQGVAAFGNERQRPRDLKTAAAAMVEKTGRRSSVQPQRRRVRWVGKNGTGEINMTSKRRSDAGGELERNDAGRPRRHSAVAENGEQWPVFGGGGEWRQQGNG